MVEQQAILESKREGGEMSRHEPLKEGLARHLAHIEREVLRIQARLGQIELDVRCPRAGQQSQPWQADVGLWAYVGILALFMSAASLLLWVWP